MRPPYPPGISGESFEVEGEDVGQLVVVDGALGLRVRLALVTEVLVLLDKLLHLRRRLDQVQQAAPRAWLLTLCRNNGIYILNLTQG